MGTASPNVAAALPPYKRQATLGQAPANAPYQPGPWSGGVTGQVPQMPQQEPPWMTMLNRLGGNLSTYGTPYAPTAGGMGQGAVPQPGGSVYYSPGGMPATYGPSGQAPVPYGTPGSANPFQGMNLPPDLGFGWAFNQAGAPGVPQQPGQPQQPSQPQEFPTPQLDLGGWGGASPDMPAGSPVNLPWADESKMWGGLMQALAQQTMAGRAADPLQQMIRNITGQAGLNAGQFATGLPGMMGGLQGFLGGQFQPQGGMGYGTAPGMAQDVMGQMMQNQITDRWGNQIPLEQGMRNLAGDELYGRGTRMLGAGGMQAAGKLLAQPETLTPEIQQNIVNRARDVMEPGLQRGQRALEERMNQRGMLDSGLTEALMLQSRMGMEGQLGTLSADLGREGAIRRPEDIARAIGVSQGVLGQKQAQGQWLANMSQEERTQWRQTGLGLEELGLRRGLGEEGLRQQYNLGLTGGTQNLINQQAAMQQQGLGNLFGYIQQQYGDPYWQYNNYLNQLQQRHAGHRQRAAEAGSAMGSGVGNLLSGLLGAGGAMVGGPVGGMVGSGLGQMAGGFF